MSLFARGAALVATVLLALGAQAAEPTAATAACLNCHDGSKPVKGTGADGKPCELHA